MSFGNSFVQAFNPAFRQGQSDYADQVRQTLMNQQRIDEENRVRRQNLIDQLNQAQLPVPYSADGKTLNEVAAFGTLGNWQRTQAAIKPYLDATARDKAQTELTAKQEGIPLTTTVTTPASSDDFGAAPTTITKPVDEATLAHMVNETKKEQYLKDLIAKKQAAAQGDYEANAFLIPKEQVQRDDQGNLTPETIKMISDAQVARDQSKTRNANLGLSRDDARRAGLTPDSPEYNKFVDRRIKYYTAPSDFKSGYLQADQQVRAGIIPANDDNAYEKTAAHYAQFGGHAPTLDNNQANTLTSDNNLLSGLQNLRDQINQFNAKNPQTPFGSFVGPLDNRTLKANLLVNEDATPQAKEAGRILQLYASLQNRRIKDTSGGQVTGNELIRNLLETGDPQSANFENAVNGWSDTVAQLYSNRLKALGDYAIPDSLKTVNGKNPDDLIGAWRQPSVPSSSSPANPASSGNSIVDQLRAKAAAGDAKAAAYLKSKGL